MYVLLSIVLFVFLAYIAFHKTRIKGTIGERKVSQKLKNLSDEYKIFNDVTIQEDKYSSQIDHIVISPYGIFVIETKNYKGNIYGGEKAEEWTQNIWGNKYSFRNPIKQNLGHVFSLMKLFNLPQSYFIPIVAFTTRCYLYVDSTSAVIYTYEVDDEILSYQNRILSEEQVERLATKLSYSSFETRDTNKEHVRYAKGSKYDYQWKIDNYICPRCGGKLIERNGKYGRFLGCCNYPRCTFTHKL